MTNYGHSQDSSFDPDFQRWADQKCAGFVQFVHKTDVFHAFLHFILRFYGKTSGDEGFWHLLNALIIKLLIKRVLTGFAHLIPVSNGELIGNLQEVTLLDTFGHF